MIIVYATIVKTDVGTDLATDLAIATQSPNPIGMIVAWTTVPKNGAQNCRITFRHCRILRHT